MAEGRVICPLLATNTFLDGNKDKQIKEQSVFCVKEKCAWWVEDKQKCAITAMGGKK